MISSQRSKGLWQNARKLTGLGTPTYEMTCTWMTGLKNSGIGRVDKLDQASIVVSGDHNKECIVTVKDLTGDTMSTIDMGNEQVRGLCVVDLRNATLLVITKWKRLELWDPMTSKLLHRLRIPDFDPCTVCKVNWDTFLIASWTQGHADMNQKQPQTDILEIQATHFKLKQLDRKLKVPLTYVIGMVKVQKLVVMTSFNNDVILAIDYLSSEIMWKLSNLEYDGIAIRPNGICSDDNGQIYIADVALPYCRIFLLSCSGKIVSKVLNTVGWCDDITWIGEDRKLVVLHDKTDLGKQDVSVYKLKKDTK